MVDETDLTSTSIPVVLLTPIKLRKDIAPELCGLFFPHHTNLPLGMVVDCDGTTHLIHLSGPHAFKYGPIDIRSSIRGLVIHDIEYDVDVTSRFNAVDAHAPSGSLILEGGELFLACELLGDRYQSGTEQVPLGKHYSSAGGTEACGFLRWSITLPDGNKRKVIHSFEAHSELR
jgi:hypothetical protein